MKNIILSILGSIISTTFILGFFIFFITGHIELMVIAGTIIMLVTFYSLIKDCLERKGE